MRFSSNPECRPARLWLCQSVRAPRVLPALLLRRAAACAAGSAALLPLRHIPSNSHSTRTRLSLSLSLSSLRIALRMAHDDDNAPPSIGERLKRRLADWNERERESAELSDLIRKTADAVRHPHIQNLMAVMMAILTADAASR
jgi:hypothetical protein